MATTNATRVAAPSETKDALLAYVDALTLAEPIQAHLWQRAEITLTQLTLLRELRAGRQPAGRLGERLGVSPTSLTRLVDRLERRGLVTRHRAADDRRVVEVQLSPAGERFLGEMRVFKDSAIHRAVEAMSSDERRRLTEALQGLVRVARAFATQEGETQ